MSTQALSRRSGWVMFAAVMMFAVGTARLVSGISYLSDSDKVADLSAGLFGDSLWAWGLWDLVIAALALFAGYSLLGGNAFGKVVAYVWALVTIVNGFLILAWAPWYGVAAIVVAGLVVYGLAVSEESSV